mgnify:CR=1 FL=1
MRHRNNFSDHRDIHLKLREIIQLRLLFAIVIMRKDFIQSLKIYRSGYGIWCRSRICVM